VVVDEPTSVSHTRVLVVDDDAVVRTLTVRLLEQLGYATVDARDGVEALARLDEWPDIALVVLDLHMPRLDGRAVLAHLRGHERHASLPVIVLTSDDGPETEVLLMDAGADDYICKPFDRERFAARVRATLRRSGRLAAV
jgi:DNA-binding response OmpR family regulator